LRTTNTVDDENNSVLIAAMHYKINENFDILLEFNELEVSICMIFDLFKKNLQANASF
jgi:hypothetical protein